MILNIRIWDKREKRMFFFPRSLINGIIINTRGNVVPILLNYTNRDPERELPSAFLVDIDGSLYESDPGRYVYMLGTGLKDKNGKEIYEGDIVKIRVNKKWWFGVVKWSEKNGWWAIDYLPTNMEGEDYDCILSEEILSMKGENRCEIIGNIFENSELLKEVKNDNK